jgi:hypothetical protein
MTAIWSFLQNGSNQATLAWIGGGIVVLAGGAWAVIKFFAKRADKATPPPSVTASHGAVAVGRDMQNSKVETNSGRKPGR